jgi:hypothetical protein
MLCSPSALALKCLLAVERDLGRIDQVGIRDVTQ